jgi:hypothetical protein
LQNTAAGFARAEAVVVTVGVVPAAEGDAAGPDPVDCWVHPATIVKEIREIIRISKKYSNLFFIGITKGGLFSALISLY